MLLQGGAGSDTITGGGGHDAMLGGEGADRLEAADRLRDRVEGGPGGDAARTDAIDRTSGIEERLR